MPEMPQMPTEAGFARKQIVLGLITIFSLYFTMNILIQTLGIARPRMAADLNGMPLYAWSISIPSLAAAFVTLLFSKFSDMYGRRFMLLVCMVLFLAGTIWSALAPTFVILIAANTVSRLGNGALLPLLYSVLGDMFAPVARSKWVGLLHLPQGLIALFGPTLGGWFVDNLSWRHLYWMGVPFLVLGLLLIPVGIPPAARRLARKIDVRGSILVAIASSATILGLSFAGTTYPWGSVQVIGLLGIALLFWVLFFKAEGHADEPIMDPQVFRNRTFLTVAVSGMLSFIGLTALMMYYPIFLQGVQGISVMKSGQILTPFSVVVGFMSVPAGFILAKTKRYKWMYITGYGLVTAVLFGIVLFDSGTPVFMCVLAATLAGLGLGTIPTINTIVVQLAVPKRLLGASMGAIFFSITMGMAIAPALLGPVMNAAYANRLDAIFPAELRQVADKEAIAAMGDPKALLSPAAMKALEASFAKMGTNGREMFSQTVGAIRNSLEAGVRAVFLLGAATMLLSFLLILTVPQVSMDAETEDKKYAKSAAAETQTRK